VATVPVTVAFSGDATKFFVGGTVTAQIVTAQTGDVVQVPARAVTTDSDGTSTVTVSLDGSTTSTRDVTVTTGTTSGGQVEITSGLTGDEQVVIRPRTFGGGTGGSGTGGSGTRTSTSARTGSGGSQ
jgi:multidrug efflux pump subunit AcrA (membrane-fusion protein)